MRGRPLRCRAARLPALACLALLLSPACVGAQSPDTPAQPPPVVHRLSFPDIRQQYVQVQSEFPVADATVDLLLPVWNPGSYHVLNYDSNLELFGVQDLDGRALAFEKVEKDLWRVHAGQAQGLRVNYRVHAGDLNVAESWVSPQWVLINAASVLMYSDGSRDAPQRLEVTLPPGLGPAMTALSPIGGSASAWRARDYDELVDNPLVIGNAPPQEFSADGADYRLVHVGDTTLWDLEQARDDVRRIVRETNDLWDEVPFERAYWFFNLLVEHRGGLEHDHSTVMMASRWAMRSREDYVKWLGLVAHEYFHAWNVRRMRPVALARYDFRREQYTPSLWLAEGITSYYDDLLLSRARVVTPLEYLDLLATQVHRLELTPGRERISLRQASRDAWTRHYQPDANAINMNISYYTKGAVLGFVLDTRIREESGGRDSLDEVMRLMYERWSATPYPQEAFAEAVEAVAGAQVRAWFEPMLSDTGLPPVDEALDWYGLELQRHPEKAAAVALGEPVPAGLGINWSEEHAPLVVGAVVHGLAAAEAGVIPGDELLAINDERITRENLDDRKARLRSGETVELLVSRQGRLLRLTATLGEARPGAYEVLASAGGLTDRHLRRLQRWLGQVVTEN